MRQTERRNSGTEIDQLTKEIDRVSETTKFNETYLLKGDGTETVKETVDVKAEAAVPVKASYVAGKGVDKVQKQKTATVPTWYAKGSTTALTADEVLDKLEIDTASGKVVLKKGVELFTDPANTTDQFGAQLEDKKVKDTLVQTLYEKGSSKLSTSDTGATTIDAADLATHFNTDGSMNKKLYAQNDAGNWVEVGAEQISKFVDVTPGKDEVQAGTKEVTKEVTKALELNLHVGADSNDTNKI